MAEFKEVLKHVRRMCNGIGRRCGECQLTSCLIDVEEDIEEMIMKWAAEHPEPKYPTIKEYLWEQFKEHGIAQLTDKGFMIWMESTEIPVDVAEMLGIEPMEG